jgi:hypothetical protein
MTGARADAQRLVPRLDADRRNAYGRSALRHVSEHHCVRANDGVCADTQRAENFRPCSNIDVTAQHRRIALAACTDGDLLQDEAVRADDSAWVDHDAIGMRHQKSAPDPRVHRNLGTGHRTPEPVAQQRPTPSDPAKWRSVIPEFLIVADRGEKSFAG